MFSFSDMFVFSFMRDFYGNSDSLKNAAGLNLTEDMSPVADSGYLKAAF